MAQVRHMLNKYLVVSVVIEQVRVIPGIVGLGDSLPYRDSVKNGV